MHALDLTQQGVRNCADAALGSTADVNASSIADCHSKAAQIMPYVPG